MSDKNKKPTYITYIGNRVYTPEKFEREAEKIGVSRAIPHHWATKLKDGDRIYTLFKRKEFSIVTGYFVVTGYSFTGPDADKLREYYHNHPDEFGITDCYEGSGETIQRGCGSYVAGGGCYVADLQTAMKRVVELIKENNWKVKIFVNGRYYKLPKKRRIKLPFTRSISEYYLDFDKVEEEEIGEKHIANIYNYHQITRHKKARKSRKRKTMPRVKEND